MAVPIAGVTYSRPPGQNDWTAPGRTTLPGPFVATASTFDVFPNLTSHPGAVWTRSGNLLTSPGRLPLPVYDITDGFVLGQTKPTWANSGCRIPISQLTTNNTINLVTTADNQVISGAYLPFGRIEVRHKNVTIRDCYISIGWAADGSGAGQRPYIQNNVAVACNANFDTSGLRLEYVTCDPVNAGNENTVIGAGTRQTADSANVSGFYVGSGSAWRCAIRNVTDGFMPDVKPAWPVDGAFHVWGCYIETRWLPQDPEQSDGTHNDCVQIAGGRNYTVIGNTLLNPTGGIPLPGDTTGKLVRGQCVVMDPYHATSDTGFGGTHDAAFMSDVSVINNWMSGAYTQISNWLPPSEGGPGVPNVTITGNRHGGQCVWPILFTPFANNSKTNVSGNIADTGGVKWNQVNGVGGTSTIAAGGAVNVTVANGAATAGNESHPTTAFAGSNQIAEPGRRFYLVAKGKNSSNAWVMTGAWSVVSNSQPGLPITITHATGSDGATFAYFDTPKPTTTQTVVLRWTPTGVAATDDMTVTIPPWQQGA